MYLCRLWGNIQNGLFCLNTQLNNKNLPGFGGSFGAFNSVAIVVAPGVVDAFLPIFGLSLKIVGGGGLLEGGTLFGWLTTSAKDLESLLLLPLVEAAEMIESVRFVESRFLL